MDEEGVDLDPNVFVKEQCTFRIGDVIIHADEYSDSDLQNSLRSTLHADDITVTSVMSDYILIDMGRSSTQNREFVPFQVEENVLGLVLSIRRTRDLTYENKICNDRGVCDDETGLCRCFDGWTSQGTLANCGALNPIPSLV